jgi:hypothetical protein
VFVPDRIVQPSPMFVGKARNLSYVGAPKKVLYLGRPQPYPQALDWAGKAYQGQTLELIMKIKKNGRKKFYSIGP